MIVKTLAMLLIGIVMPVAVYPQAAQTAANLQQPSSYRGSSTTSADNNLRVETVLPSDGLQLYFEIRNSGLEQLADAPSLLTPLAEMLKVAPKRFSSTDVANFLLGNSSALREARVVAASYGSGGVLVVETANSDTASRLAGAFSGLLGVRTARASREAVSDTANIDVVSRGRLVMAGPRAFVTRLATHHGSFTISENPQFVKAQTRFSDDPFFAYFEMSGAPMGWLTNGPAPEVAHAAGAIAALNSRPFTMAAGSSIEGTTARMRALLFLDGQVGGGLLSAVMSATKPGTAVAASYAPADSDLFFNLMLDWDSVYDSIESLFGALAGAAMSSANRTPALEHGSLFAAADAALGFSIKHELIPTLGNEIALSLSGLTDTLATSGSVKRSGSPKKATPKFLLLLALKDPAGFEQLLVRLLTRQTGKPAQPFTRSLHRGVTVNHRSDVAFAISDGFLIVAGTAAEVRRAIDAHTLGGSLALSRRFQSTIDVSGPTVMQIYLAPSTAKELFRAISKEPSLAELFKGTDQVNSALGFVMTSEAEGLMVETQMPLNLLVAGLSAFASGTRFNHGITDSNSGVGITIPQAPRQRRSSTPRLTTDDIRGRRP